ncbi:MAG TPA: cytochrome C oxidase subunit I [Burkholderiales bacterium]|nr:cytochrome C oxidase subunit I [Burkholderiales bacterium]
MIALIFLVCVLPSFGSYALYLFWRPEKFVNYGDLIKPVPLVDVTVRERDGEEFHFTDLRGKWVFLMADVSSCDDHCRQKLYFMRQVRLTQGNEQHRIERLWLVTDGRQPAAELAAEYAGTQQVLLADRALLARLPATGDASDHIFVVDPVGNLMMRYARDPDPSRMKRDIARLLRVSAGWVQRER